MFSVGRRSNTSKHSFSLYRKQSFKKKVAIEKLYLLLFNSNGGGPALAPCPCDVHKRPILVDVGVEVDVIDEVDGFLMVAVDDGGRMPVGFGNRDDAFDTSLLIDFSDGVGDDARSATFCGS